MQEYDVNCPVHGDGVTTGSMKDAMAGKLPCFDESCIAPISRRFPRGRYATDHSENTFKPYHCENLSHGTDPVLVTSRADEQRKMQAMGLMRWEAGMGKEKNVTWSSRDRDR